MMYECISAMASKEYAKKIKESEIKRKKSTNKENFLGEEIRKGKMGCIQKDTQLYSMMGFETNGNRIFFGPSGSGKN